MKLLALIEQAKVLGGMETTCEQSGHDWFTIGGRSCPTGNQMCSQPVFMCKRCEVYDYGYNDGPAHFECTAKCGKSLLGWF